MKQTIQPLSHHAISLKQALSGMFRPAAVLTLAAAALILGSCASKKAAVDTAGTTLPKAQNNATAGTQEASKSNSAAALNFVQRVSDGKVYAQNITGDANIKLKTDEKTISLPGALRMRKDKVIRLQLFVPLLGSEVGRLEFTPDYVLVVDRMHKKYARATYDQVSFLAANGLSYYSLQALFWNQLFLPGKQKVGETDLKKFSVDLSAAGTTHPLTVENGSMKYTWNADKSSARILSARAAYTSKSHGSSSLDWTYDDFKSVGAKTFPAKQSFSFTTTATGERKSGSVSISMSEVQTDSDWEAETKLSSKYTEIDVEDLFKNLVNLQ